MTRVEIDSNTYCDLSIYQYWESVYRNDCSCGIEKTRTWRKKSGWSKEYSIAIEAELGFSLNIGLASLSPKITAKINRSLNMSLEEEEQEETKFTAPKCGKHEIAIYQLISEWHIKLLKLSWFRLLLSWLLTSAAIAVLAAVISSLLRILATASSIFFTSLMYSLPITLDA